MQLTDFMTIIDKLLESSTMVYTVTNNAILIDEPQVSLFGMMVGFMVLFLFFEIINFFRPSSEEEYTPPTAEQHFRNRQIEVHGKRRRY